MNSTGSFCSLFVKPPLLFCFSAFCCLKCQKLYLQALPECSLRWLRLTLFYLIILSPFLSHSIMCRAGSSCHRGSQRREGKKSGFQTVSSMCGHAAGELLHRKVSQTDPLNPVKFNNSDSDETYYILTTVYYYSVLISLNTYFL